MPGPPTRRPAGTGADVEPPQDAPRSVRTRAWAVGLGLGWVLVLAVPQAVIGGRLVVVPWLALGPLCVALVLTWGWTLLVALVSVAAVALLSRQTGDLGTTQGSVRVAGSAALAAFSVLSARVRVVRERRIRRMTRIATVAQAAILHPVPERVAGIALGSRYVSASVGAMVGGDLYEVVPYGQGLRVVLGDARGKGLGALRSSSAVLSAFRSLAADPALDLEGLARAIDVAVAPSFTDEDFVTAVLAEVRRDGSVALVLCGHPTPLVSSPGRRAREVAAVPGPPLGLGFDARAHRLHLAPGERLVLFTDGLVEARDGSGRFFGLLDAVTGLDRRADPRPGLRRDAIPGDLDDLLRRLREHVGHRLDDDVAVLVLQPMGDESDPAE